MLVLAGVLACSSDPPSDGGASPTDGGEDPAPTFTGRPVGEPTGACPAFAAPGTQDLVSNGAEREIEAYWPADHEGPIGLLYAWHGLGDRADSFAAVLDLAAFAEDHELLVVVPYSENPDLLTWNFLTGEGNDVVLVDDIRNCAAQSFELDLSRVYSTGFSFGAVWTTFLTLTASDMLAATVIFSGGTGDSVQLPYTPPVTDIPVLATWGGDRDAIDAGIFAVDFAETTADLTTHLTADGHVVVGCDHGLGHTVPPTYVQILENFLLTARFGVRSHYADGDLADLPAYCE